MPLQNRVNPCGTIFSCPERGTFMGNRGGAIHNQQREIVRQYASRRWITCLLEFKGRRRSVMSPGRYTELFFLDEAVALSAGHRPCAECRRQQYNAFRNAWTRSHHASEAISSLADQIDLELHRSRFDRRNGKITYQASLHSLPDGCFVQIDGSNYLVWGDALFLWSPGAYLSKHSRLKDLTAHTQSNDVSVLTPQLIVECLRQGYRPEIHPSAFSL